LSRVCVGVGFNFACGGCCRYKPSRQCSTCAADPSNKPMLTKAGCTPAFIEHLCEARASEPSLSHSRRGDRHFRTHGPFARPVPPCMHGWQTTNSGSTDPFLRSPRGDAGLATQEGCWARSCIAVHARRHIVAMLSQGLHSTLAALFVRHSPCCTVCSSQPLLHYLSVSKTANFNSFQKHRSPQKRISKVQMLNVCPRPRPVRTPVRATMFTALQIEFVTGRL
jgi:hypothetical protein